MGRARGGPAERARGARVARGRAACAGQGNGGRGPDRRCRSLNRPASCCTRPQSRRRDCRRHRDGDVAAGRRCPAPRRRRRRPARHQRGAIAHLAYYDAAGALAIDPPPCAASPSASRLAPTTPPLARPGTSAPPSPPTSTCGTAEAVVGDGSEHKGSRATVPGPPCFPPPPLVRYNHGVRFWIALILLGAVACETVPITGRSQMMLVTEGEEAQMGLESYQQILGKAKVSTDARLTEQVTRVGRRIAEATERKDYQWEFKVIEDPQANAFCLPGGKVAVYTGILPITRDDAGPGGRARPRGGARDRASRRRAHVAAARGAGRPSRATQTLLAGTRSRRRFSSVSGLLGAGATVGLLLPWGRSQESEADHLGLIYMAKAGYHPQAARDLWVRMGEASRKVPRPARVPLHPSARRPPGSPRSRGGSRRPCSTTGPAETRPAPSGPFIPPSRGDQSWDPPTGRPTMG